MSIDLAKKVTTFFISMSVSAAITTAISHKLPEYSVEKTGYSNIRMIDMGELGTRFLPDTERIILVKHSGLDSDVMQGLGNLLMFIGLYRYGTSRSMKDDRITIKELREYYRTNQKV